MGLAHRLAWMISGLALLKLSIALVAMLVLGAEVLRGRRGGDGNRLLLACAVLAAGAYFAPGLERAAFVHRWEMFHYYVGAKYQAELGYERLYTCVMAVDVADGVQDARTRRVRDLRTDALTTGISSSARQRRARKASLPRAGPSSSATCARSGDRAAAGATQHLSRRLHWTPA